jgi:hypothetical protein
MYNAATLQVFGKENLYAASQDLSDSAWTLSASGTGSNPIVTPNNAIAPDGTMTASQVEFDSGSGTTTDGTASSSMLSSAQRWPSDRGGRGRRSSWRDRLPPTWWTS